MPRPIPPQPPASSEPPASSVVVTVNIPGLAELVALLLGAEQREIDEIAARVEQLVTRLRTSTTALQSATNQETINNGS